MADDIKGIGAIGAGGIEFLNYYLVSSFTHCKVPHLIFEQYGGEFGSESSAILGGGSGGGPATDWDIYGYGTPSYNAILKAALQATKDNGLIMDFAMGPQSGQGVPAEIDNR